MPRLKRPCNTCGRPGTLLGRCRSCARRAAEYADDGITEAELDAMIAARRPTMPVESARDGSSVRGVQAVRLVRLGRRWNRKIF